jgi:hypothetical protein
MRKLPSLQRRSIRTIRDRNGKVRVFEKGSSIPFPLKRCFVISNVPKSQARGGHPVGCDELLVMLTGACRLTFQSGDKSTRTSSMTLSKRTQGVLVRKGTWLQLDRFSDEALLLVCASQTYRPGRPRT